MPVFLACLPKYDAGNAGIFAHTDNNVDTIAIQHIILKANNIYEASPDSSLFYGQRAITLSRQSNYPKGLADGLLRTADVYSLRGNYNEAKKRYDEAVKTYNRINDYQGLGKCYTMYGNLYNLLANYPLALKYLTKSIAVLSRINDEEALADAYVYMGIVYDSMGQQSEALDYYYKSLFINIKQHNDIAAADNYNNIGVILQHMEVYPKSLEYYQKAISIWQKEQDLSGLSTADENIGEVLLAQKKYDGAIVYLKRSMLIAQKQKDRDGLSSLFTDLGLCYAHKNQFNIAIKYLDSSLTIAEQYKITYNRANALIAFATIYNLQNKFKQAYKYAATAEGLANKLGNTGIKANASLQLSETLAGLKAFEQSHHYLQLYAQQRDSLKNNESLEKLTAYSLELNLSAGQQQLKQQQREKDMLYRQKIKTERLINTIFLIIIIGMLIVIAVYARQKMKQKAINTLLEDRNTQILHQKNDIKDKAGRLGDLNTLKDRLIAILAHDLRAPLSTLRGLFNLLIDDSVTHQQFLEMAPQVLKKLEYTSDFLDTLLFWINSQMENFEHTAVSFKVQLLVNREIENLTEEAQQKGIQVINLIDEHASAFTDPNCIRIVVHNLITNAIKFSSAGDRVSISASSNTENYITITIKDTGLGMPAELVGKLFKSNVVSSSGTNNEPGTGMGLLFCKDLIEKCKGEIWVNSKPGSGTEFFIKLPANNHEFSTE